MRNSVSNEFVSLVPAKGANLNQLVLTNNRCLCPIVAGADNFEEFIDKYILKFAGLKFFPFPYRTAQACYKYGKKVHILDFNDQFSLKNALHGFVFNQPISIIGENVNADCVSIIMAFQTMQELKGYPFNVRLEVNYELSKNGLSVATRVKKILENRPCPLEMVGIHIFALAQPLTNLFSKYPLRIFCRPTIN